jgi:hypothetical protein
MRAVRETMAAQGLQAEGHITRRPTFDADKAAATYERAMTRGAAQRIESQSGYAISGRDARAAAQAERAAVNAGTYVAPTGPRYVTMLQGVTNRRQARDFNAQRDQALLNAAQDYYNAGDADAMQGALSQLTTDTQQAIAAQLGDYSGDIQTYNYAGWYSYTKNVNGVVTAWPFNSGLYARYYGKPAARFDAATYVAVSNRGAMLASDAQQASADNKYVYVLAPQSAWAGAPQTMGAGGSFLNAIFGAGDTAADKLGLPSLAGIENFLKSLGADALLLAAVGATAWYLLKGRGGLRSWAD